MPASALMKATATASFVANIALQTHGVVSGGMLATHERFITAFSPAPAAVALSFISVQLLSVVWLVLLWRTPAASVDDNDNDNDNTYLLEAYLPYFIGVHLALAGWAPLWSEGTPMTLLLSAMLVALMAGLQAWFLIGRLGMHTLSSASLVGQGSQPAPLLTTHLLVKLGLALSVLDTLHAGSVGIAPDALSQPHLLVAIAAALLFAALAFLADGILGLGLVGVLAGLATGQVKYATEDGWWPLFLWALAAGVAVLVLARNYMRSSRGYEQIRG